MVPGRGADRLEADRDPLRGLGLERRRGVALDRVDPLRVADGELARRTRRPFGCRGSARPRPRSGSRAARCTRSPSRPAASRAGRARGCGPSATWRRSRSRSRRRGRSEPHRHRVRPAARADRADDDDALGVEQLRLLGLAQLDLVAAARHRRSVNQLARVEPRPRPRASPGAPASPSRRPGASAPGRPPRRRRAAARASARRRRARRPERARGRAGARRTRRSSPPGR